MSEARRVVSLAVVVLCLGACASSQPAAPKDPQLAQREAECRNRMYLERANRGRAAVNWNVYEMCMREPR